MLIHVLRRSVIKDVEKVAAGETTLKRNTRGNQPIEWLDKADASDLYGCRSTWKQS